MEMKKYQFQDKLVSGVEVEVESSSETWSQYSLTDGTKVKAKLVLLDVVRLDAFDESGEPLYQFQFQNIIGVVAPDTLKKKD